MARPYGTAEQVRRRKADRAIFALVCFIVAVIASLLSVKPEQWPELLHGAIRACSSQYEQSLPPEVSDSQMVIHIIDVGQGDSVLVQSGETNILIDAGEAYMGDDVLLYLYAHGVYELDWLVMTHPHSDHIGGVPTVLDGTKVENIMFPYISDRFSAGELWPEVLVDAIEREGVIPVQAEPGRNYDFGEMTMTVVWPLTSYDGADLNDYSIGLRFSGGGVDFFTCGDMTDSSEDDLIDSGFDISCEIMKSNHHGSTYANGSDFLYEVMPELALISCGRDNDYGHPHDELLYRYEYYGIDWKRTDVAGSITVTCENGEYTIKTQN